MDLELGCVRNGIPVLYIYGTVVLGCVTSYNKGLPWTEIQATKIFLNAALAENARNYKNRPCAAPYLGGQKTHAEHSRDHVCEFVNRFPADRRKVEVSLFSVVFETAWS
jgi:hypothetical protein